MTAALNYNENINLKRANFLGGRTFNFIISELVCSSPKPPYNDKEPKDEDQEDDVPQPSTTLPLGHVVHSAEGSCEDA